MAEDLELLREKKGFICDMDGVIYHGNRLLPGVTDFVAWLQRENKSFLFLTNSSERSPLELQQKLARMGLEIGEEHFYTSALATARFIASQKPHASAYVIGAPGLVGALYEAGIVMNDVDPDYVIAGETNTYNYQTILKAVDLINKGARLIATNSDLTGPSEQGIIPACRALVAPIELATGKTAYYVGKPNPLMMRTRSAPAWRTFARGGHDRRPHGHRHRCRHRDRSGYRARAERLHLARGSGELRIPSALYSGRRGLRRTVKPAAQLQLCRQMCSDCTSGILSEEKRRNVKNRRSFFFVSYFL